MVERYSFTGTRALCIHETLRGRMTWYTGYSTRISEAFSANGARFFRLDIGRIPAPRYSCVLRENIFEK